MPLRKMPTKQAYILLHALKCQFNPDETMRQDPIAATDMKAVLLQARSHS